MRTALEIDQLKKIYKQIAHRYDLQHGFITAKSDQRGRRMVVDRTIHPGDTVLDAGAGTGSTGILAARKAGFSGSITFFDLCDEMIAVAREKVVREQLVTNIRFETGDMCHLPFADAHFDVALSTYSLCPLYNPAAGALEMYRVIKPGGRIGIAHSTEPTSPAVKWLADRVEDIAWKIPSLSMGCRVVDVNSALEQAGGKIVLNTMIGIPLWPFRVLIVEKPKG
ncbi:MAG: class I SAM-dependent methyltransferase [Mariprofundus sp.]|nr:class I SAM-dependent methyltransferase [Mariprofundus sp.]